MADIFISYKSERRNAAQHLSRILELNGYSVWFDYGLFSGINFGRQIEREIRAAAKAVVVLWCSLSRVSRWVLEEADLAQSLETFTPVWLERVRASARLQTCRHHRLNDVGRRSTKSSPR